MSTLQQHDSFEPYYAGREQIQPPRKLNDKPVKKPLRVTPEDGDPAELTDPACPKH